MINKAIYLKKKFFILKSEQTEKYSLRLLDSVNSIFKLNYIDIDDEKNKEIYQIQIYLTKKNIRDLL